MSLRWRTLALLALLLAGLAVIWLPVLRELDQEPRAVQAGQQAAALVRMARAALAAPRDPGRPAALEAALEAVLGPPTGSAPGRAVGAGPDAAVAGRVAVAVATRAATDSWEPYETDRYSRRVAEEVRAALGPDTLVARRFGERAGLWIGFDAGRGSYWLRTEAGPPAAPLPAGGVAWIGVALLLTLAAAATVGALINRPLRQLSFAASRISSGNLESRLDESTLTSEIREVNRGFNRMARELARVEEDRAVMLAGISHDLRTPLARLRLETEMSVADEEARRNMASDIDQLDAIIDKFMEYARPGETQTRPLLLAPLIEREMSRLRDQTQIRIVSRVPDDLAVMADETELGRVFLNLFENARRYGRSIDSGVAEVGVSSVRAGTWTIVSVRDKGLGVAPEKLSQLTTPFFRGDAARTAATGAGLGLAIVDKSMQRMGGTLELANAPEGGLVAHLRLRRASTAA